MSQKLKNTFLALAATAAGFCNGLIGAGGGILLTLTLNRLFSDRFPDKRSIYVNSQAAMIPGCIISCIIYYCRGMLDTTGFSIFIIPAVAGGIIGSLLLTRVKSGLIQTAFAVIVIWSGARMLFG